MLGFRRALLLTLLACSALGTLHAQVAAPPDPSPYPYVRKNSFSVFGEYSNDSSHMLMGISQNRKLATFGFGYTRRIFLRPYLNLQYLAELRPVVMESDPVTTITDSYVGPPENTVTSFTEVLPLACPATPVTITGTYPDGPFAGYPYTLTISYKCTRQWTYGQAFSPIGLRFNFLPHHRIQPVVTMAGGYLFTTRPIPVANAGSFNFTLQFGGGVEFFLSREHTNHFFGNRSIRAEYRFHHTSNADTATSNPGIDNGLFQVAFSFGR
jgi:hypothetical protein